MEHAFRLARLVVVIVVQFFIILIVFRFAGYGRIGFIRVIVIGRRRMRSASASYSRLLQLIALGRSSTIALARFERVRRRRSGLSFRVGQKLVVQLSHVLLEIEISTEAFVADGALERFLFSMRMHVEFQIVDLMKCFIAHGAFVLLFAAMSETMVLVIALLVESFAAKLADERLVAYKAERNAYGS